MHITMNNIQLNYDDVIDAINVEKLEHDVHGDVFNIVRHITKNEYEESRSVNIDNIEIEDEVSGNHRGGVYTGFSDSGERIIFVDFENRSKYELKRRKLGYVIGRCMNLPMPTHHFFDEGIISIYSGDYILKDKKHHSKMNFNSFLTDLAKSVVMCNYDLNHKNVVVNENGKYSFIDVCCRYNGKFKPLLVYSTANKCIRAYQDLNNHNFPIFSQILSYRVKDIALILSSYYNNIEKTYPSLNKRLRFSSNIHPITLDTFQLDDSDCIWGSLQEIKSIPYEYNEDLIKVNMRDFDFSELC